MADSSPASSRAPSSSGRRGRHSSSRGGGSWQFRPSPPHPVAAPGPLSSHRPRLQPDGFADPAAPPSFPQPGHRNTPILSHYRVVGSLPSQDVRRVVSQAHGDAHPSGTEEVRASEIMPHPVDVFVGHLGEGFGTGTGAGEPMQTLWHHGDAHPPQNQRNAPHGETQDVRMEKVMGGADCQQIPPTRQRRQSQMGPSQRNRGHQHDSVAVPRREVQDVCTQNFLDAADGQHRPAPSRQWRQSQVGSSQRNRGHQHDSTANARGRDSYPQAIEFSRGAVEDVLQSLTIEREHGDFDTSQRNRHDGGRQWGSRSKRVPKHNNSNTKQADNVVPLNALQNAIKDKTNIPLLVQELEEKLSKGQIECMICYDMVKREAAIWSCGGCYAIFHIVCIRKWARAPNSADFSLSTSNTVTVGNWRCPGCQSPQFISADDLRYACFCGQVVEPQVDYYLTPHSCGGPCKKPLGSGKSSQCEHICTMQCHPGPCPPCNAVAPPQFCPCGKMSYTRRCSEQKTAKTCAQPCGHQLYCGRHYCKKTCHEGPCASCDAILTVSCFCRKRVEAMICGTMDLQGELDWESGVFSCEQPCPNKLQCGRHLCNKKCHPGQCGDCDLAPGKVVVCPCGKVPIQKLLGIDKQRKLCSDPVPCCGQRCDKLLPCGKHTCQSLCHMGDCPPCEVLVEQKCRCKSSSQTMPCCKAVAVEGAHKVMETAEDCDGLFLCNRTCGKKKSCGRHRCSNKCCPLANDDGVVATGDDNAHLCALPCGKKLRCGQHVCQELCHNGHCPPCLESTFTELSCACGKTSIPPPVPCGTPAPACPHPCAVAQPCGHPATHSCHFGECPPCVVPTSKECVGNHVMLRNVPCGARDIKCNTMCGKVRQCGLHACGRTCHLPPCDPPVNSSMSQTTHKSCGQECGAPRRECGHVCVAPCHPSTPCPESRCKFQVTINCSCGRLSQQVPCDAGEASKGSDTLELAYYANLPLQPVDSKARIPLGQRTLACDEDCAKLEKKRLLADAFGVPSVSTDAAIAAESVQAASEALRDLLRKDPEWVLGVEERFKYLVLGSKSPSVGPIRVHVFCCLPKEKRDVVRQIAERWNLAVSSVGREPRRFLTVHVNSKARTPPLRSLIGRSPLSLPGLAQAPAFSPALDMDPRLVVGLFDLPRDADISTLVLRFGGECELVWLNDKNALAVFSDIARAATAVRRVDHASVYTGAVRASLPTSSPHVWGFAESGGTKSTGRRKNVQESTWSEDAWGDELERLQAKTVWNRGAAAITVSHNPWGALEQEDSQVKASSSTAASSSSSSAIQGVATPAVTAAAENWEDLDG